VIVLERRYRKLRDGFASKALQAKAVDENVA